MKKMFAAMLAMILAMALLSGCGIYVRSNDGSINGNFSTGFEFNTGTPAYEEKGHKAFYVGKSGILSIEADNVELNVEGADVPQIQIDYAKQIFGKNIAQDEAQDIMDQMSVIIEQKGEEVHIKADTRKGMNSGINISNRLIVLDIKLPTDMRMTIDNGNGVIKIKDMAGDVDIDNGNALIDLTDVSGNVGIDTGNGAMRLASGNIGDLSVKSGNGLVELSLGKLTGNSYDITTGNGMVQLTVPQDIAADFEITTARGAVDSDFSLSKSNRTYTGSVNGGGPKIKISTGNGMVSVQKK
ncbi:DUF4097 family beta strand repeat-containing protein [Mahella australiensis]|uniref:DUF4097 domain-containing protein n=1 Tax=Mahella australiensis (strain DSM 15567 / CIP 107919 / 50-1 BON) TaxID=697281 RepID=F3ZWM1_MAHA5|nr:DUF4097 family beta strand repeat-containing protein [Mahella australiensis]AEE96464.1 hypothetical protein Mahau_1270 [Mahella australiensis 50-1 BON]